MAPLPAPWSPSPDMPATSTIQYPNSCAAGVVTQKAVEALLSGRARSAAFAHARPASATASLHADATPRDGGCTARDRLFLAHAGRPPVPVISAMPLEIASSDCNFGNTGRQRPHSASAAPATARTSQRPLQDEALAISSAGGATSRRPVSAGALIGGSVAKRNGPTVIRRSDRSMRSEPSRCASPDLHEKENGSVVSASTGDPYGSTGPGYVAEDVEPNRTVGASPCPASPDTVATMAVSSPGLDSTPIAGKRFPAPVSSWEAWRQDNPQGAWNAPAVGCESDSKCKPHLVAGASRWTPKASVPEVCQWRHDPILHEVDMFLRDEDGVVTGERQPAKESYFMATRKAATAPAGVPQGIRQLGRRPGLAEFSKLRVADATWGPAYHAALARNSHHFYRRAAGSPVKRHGAQPSPAAPAKPQDRPLTARERHPPHLGVALVGQKRCEAPVLVAPTIGVPA